MAARRAIALFFFITTLAAAAPVTFNQHIAGIVYRNCAPCHRPGESAPFSLLSYEDVKRRAVLVATVTGRRYMPPWLPEPGHGEFAEQRRLTDAEIRLIQEWVKQGTPLGSGRTPPPPKFADEWQLGPPDLILRVSRPFQLPADGNEIFWNFILPVPITTTRWVKAIEVRPGSSKAFHHANVIIDRSGAAARQEKVPGGGFSGMDLNIEEETFDPDGHFLSWKPGSEPVVEPDGMAWRANPGMNLILNVHLRPSGKPETISPMIGLYFTGQPQKTFPMLVQLEHDSAIDIPPGDKDFLLTDDLKLPLDVNVLAVYPHAHYLGKLMEGYATLPDGSRKWLIRIPDWDLNWQGVFRFKEPVFLPAGSVVSMRYHYDNSAGNVRNPSNPPREVKGGNESINEMGHLWLQVLPTAPGDQRAALQEGLVRQRLEKYPDDFTANYDLAESLLGKGDAAGAIPYFQAACKSNPASVVAATELGTALFSVGKLAEAEEQFKAALALDAAYTDTRFDLASVQAARGEWEPAVTEFQRVLQQRPDDSKTRGHLGDALYLWGDDFAKSGNNEQALERYRASLEFRPPDAGVHTKMALMLARLSRLAEAQSELEAALKLDPGFAPPSACCRMSRRG
ncbi:MAG: tetratricopeptide repeat protein [Candidatus Sulfopaludibacter sp.]|nr:tetratricopeptide repeat protein [Candidatus Sulfopaludibacter sp.]